MDWQGVLSIIYIVFGYWAAGVVFYQNKIVIYSFGQLFLRKFFLGLFLGFILIPVAIIMKLVGAR